jgi:hypothetical protein
MFPKLRYVFQEKAPPNIEERRGCNHKWGSTLNFEDE